MKTNISEDYWNANYLRSLISLRLFVLAAVHLVGFFLVFAAAFWLRFDFTLPERMRSIFWSSIPAVALIKVVIFCWTGIFFGWWRYVTFADLTALVHASALSFLIIGGLDYFLVSQWQIPRSVLLLDFGLTVMLFGGLRSTIRLSREHFWPSLRKKRRSKALLVGADESAAALVSRIHNHSQLPYRIVGFLDSDKRKHRSRLGGIPVLGQLGHLRQIADQKGVENILVPADRMSGPIMLELTKRCEEAGLGLKIIPSLDEVLDGNQRIYVRDVCIDDLLGRDPVQLDSKAIGDILLNKSVMVTGAGGSIGSEICRQVLKYQPKSLILVERAENSLFHIERELIGIGSAAVIHPCIADITDTQRMEQLFIAHRPEVLFHAAAHKHVPMMESNVGEAIKNNLFGTKQVADLAHSHSVERFVLISTDKAVNPTSVMGVSKQLAERYIHSLSEDSPTRFMVVRFGNVLGSAGSVVPIFQEQIRRGGPVTVTDPRMTRYFMTIPEASQLVLQAASMGRGGEIFVLDMGAPVRIVDLARDLIRLSGVPTDAIDIVFTGLRPGEKLYEELYFDEEESLPTSHSKMRAVYHRPYLQDEVGQMLAELSALANGPEARIRALLHELIPEFQQPRLPETQEQPQPVSECESATE